MFNLSVSYGTDINFVVMADTDDLTQGLNQLSQNMNQIALTATKEKSIKRQLQANKDMADYNNNIALQNYERSRRDALTDISQSYARDKQARQNAGMSPSWSSDDAGSMMPSTSFGTQGTASAPDIMSQVGKSEDFGLRSFSELMTAQLQMAQIDNLRAQNDNIVADTKKKDAEIANTELDNVFLANTMDARVSQSHSTAEKVGVDVQLSKEELWYKKELNALYAEHPEYLEAVASAQKTLNSQVLANISQIRSNIRLIEAQIDNVNEDTKLKAEQALLTSYEQTFTLAQLEVLQDRNVREHYNDVGFLLKEMHSIENDPDIDDDERNEQLALLRDMYDDATGVHKQRLEYEFKGEMQEKELDYKYDELLFRGADSVIGKLEKRRRNAQKNRNGNGRPVSDYDVRRGRRSTARSGKKTVFDN